MKLETKRLILREPKKSDWEDMVEGAKELDVSKNLGLMPHPYTKKDAEEWINIVKEKWKKKEKDDYEFFIELKSERKYIGGIALHIDLRNKVGKTGSWLIKNIGEKVILQRLKLQ